MSEKRFRVKRDEIDSAVINIQDNHQDFAWFLSDVITDVQVQKVVDLLNSLYEENKYLKKRFKSISDELYCKDRKLEELGVPIECCDEDE